MCLDIKHLKPKIADKDIVCYKLVKKLKLKVFINQAFKDLNI